MTPEIQSARDALTASPDDRALQLALARTLVDAAWFESSSWADHYSEATAIYREMLKTDPEDAIVLVNLGAVLSDMGSHQRALTHYERAISHGADDRHLHFNLGVACVNLRQHNGATGTCRLQR